MPVLISACFVLVVQLHVSEGCVLISAVCTAHLAYTFHIMSYVMSDMLPCSCLIVEPDLGHTSIGSGCVLQCICVYKSARFWTCQYRPRHYTVTGFVPLRCDLSVLLKLQAASPHRLRTPARSDSHQEQLQRAGHEPVCLVPVYGPVPAYA